MPDAYIVCRRRRSVSEAGSKRHRLIFSEPPTSWIPTRNPLGGRGPGTVSLESPCESLRVRSSVDEKLSKGTLRVVATVGMPIGNVLEKLPVEGVPLEPARKLSMLDVRPLILSIVIRVARIDDDVAMRRPNERVHVVFEHPVFHQVVDHVERKRQVGLLTSILAHEGERLRRVTGEQAPALAHRCLTHVVSGVHRVSRQQQLVSVATTKFHDRLYPPCLHEGIDHFGLERRELSVGADTRISFRIISIFPIFSGSREGFRRRAHCRQPPIKFSGQVSEHQSFADEVLHLERSPGGRMTRLIRARSVSLGSPECLASYPDPRGPPSGLPCCQSASYPDLGGALSRHCSAPSRNSTLLFLSP